MNKLATKRASNLPTQFNPEKTLDKQSQADAIIAYAKKLRDWPLLEQAIDAKIEEQHELCRWWDEKVTPGMRVKGVSVSVAETDITLDQAEALTGFSKLQIHRIRKRLADEDTYRAALYGAAWKKAFPELNEDQSVVALKHTGDEESYTPAKYLDSARVVMGEIDTDPASNPMAQEYVRAGVYYTRRDDGLQQEWTGTVWMNPPYTARVINQFIDKLVKHYQAGDVTQAIVLTNNNTDTSWFHNAAGSASAICFTAGRINFLKPDGTTSSPTNGQSFFYFGENLESFKAEFSRHGLVMVKA